VTWRVLVSAQQALARARRRQREQNRAASNALRVGRRLWRQVDRGSIVDSWARLVPQLVAVIAATQLVAGRDADEYVTAVLDDQGINPEAEGQFATGSLVGLAADGGDLAEALMWPAWASIAALTAGAAVGRAMAVGMMAADLTTTTQVQDAFRVSAGAAAAARPFSQSWVRVLTGGFSCSRCIILAGQSSWSTAFQRHPRCDCASVPSARSKAGDLMDSPEDIFASMSRDEQDRAFGPAGAQAIRDGADMNSVVNARRKVAGIKSAAQSQLGLIREQGILDEVQGIRGNPRITFSRGPNQGRRDRRVRVMPETIYKVARDRDHAIELLRANGFIYGASANRR
jgi:hypothetical protein